MPATIEKEENEQIQDNLSMFNTMVLSPTKRQEMYDFYDKNYKETEDDRSFCKNMKNRRRLEK